MPDLYARVRACPVCQFDVQLYVEKVFIAQNEEKKKKHRKTVIKILKKKRGKRRYGVGRLAGEKLGEGGVEKATEEGEKKEKTVLRTRWRKKSPDRVKKKIIALTRSRRKRNATKDK